MAHKLIENPETKEVFFADFERGTIYDICGMAFETTQTHKSWPDVAKAAPPHLFAWQEDPDTYGPHHVLARVMLADGAVFTAGGPFLYIMAWAKENNAVAIPLKCFADRNLARRSADVEW